MNWFEGLEESIKPLSLYLNSLKKHCDIFALSDKLRNKAASFQQENLAAYLSKVEFWET